MSPPSGHIQESTSDCVSKWNSKSMSPSLALPLSQSQHTYAQGEDFNKIPCQTLNQNLGGRSQASVIFKDFASDSNGQQSLGAIHIRMEKKCREWQE